MLRTNTWATFMATLLLPTALLAAAKPASGADHTGPSEVLESAVFIDEDGAELAYRIHVPAQASGGSKLPLVLFLHGAGERGDDNEAQLKHGVREFVTADRATRFPAIVVAPQCPEDLRWVDVDWSSTDSEGSFSAEPTATMKRVFALLDRLILRGNVDTSRLYVTGLSMGGYGSWYAAAMYRAPDMTARAADGSAEQRAGGFAAMLAICGGGDSTWTQHYDPVSVWAVHGDADRAVPVVRSRSMIAALVQAGHPGEIRYTERAGVGHDSWTQTYADDQTYDWLFDQARR